MTSTGITAVASEQRDNAPKKLTKRQLLSRTIMMLNDEDNLPGRLEALRALRGGEDDDDALDEYVKASPEISELVKTWKVVSRNVIEGEKHVYHILMRIMRGEKHRDLALKLFSRNRSECLELVAKRIASLRPFPSVTPSAQPSRIYTNDEDEVLSLIFELLTLVCSSSVTPARELVAKLDFGAIDFLLSTHPPRSIAALVNLARACLVTEEEPVANDAVTWIDKYLSSAVAASSYDDDDSTTNSLISDFTRLVETLTESPLLGLNTISGHRDERQPPQEEDEIDRPLLRRVSGRCGRMLKDFAILTRGPVRDGDSSLRAVVESFLSRLLLASPTSLRVYLAELDPVREEFHCKLVEEGLRRGAVSFSAVVTHKAWMHPLVSLPPPGSASARFAWICAVAFACRVSRVQIVLTQQSHVTSTMKDDEDETEEREEDPLAEVLPPSRFFNRNVLSKGIQAKDSLIRLFVLDMLSHFLSRAIRMRDAKSWSERPEERRHFLSALSQRFPDAAPLISILTSAPASHRDEEKKGDNDEKDRTCFLRALSLLHDYGEIVLSSVTSSTSLDVLKVVPRAFARCFPEFGVNNNGNEDTESVDRTFLAECSHRLSLLLLRHARPLRDDWLRSSSVISHASGGSLSAIGVCILFVVRLAQTFPLGEGNAAEEYLNRALLPPWIAMLCRGFKTLDAEIWTGEDDVEGEESAATEDDDMALAGPLTPGGGEYEIVSRRGKMRVMDVLASLMAINDEVALMEKIRGVEIRWKDKKREETPPRVSSSLRYEADAGDELRLCGTLGDLGEAFNRVRRREGLVRLHAAFMTARRCLALLSSSPPSNEDEAKAGEIISSCLTVARGADARLSTTSSLSAQATAARRHFLAIVEECAEELSKRVMAKLTHLPVDFFLRFLPILTPERVGIVLNEALGRVVGEKKKSNRGENVKRVLESAPWALRRATLENWHAICDLVMEETPHEGNVAPLLTRYLLGADEEDEDDDADQTMSDAIINEVLTRRVDAFRILILDVLLPSHASGGGATSFCNATARRRVANLTRLDSLVSPLIAARLQTTDCFDDGDDDINPNAILFVVTCAHSNNADVRRAARECASGALVRLRFIASSSARFLTSLAHELLQLLETSSSGKARQEDDDGQTRKKRKLVSVEDVLRAENRMDDDDAATLLLSHLETCQPVEENVASLIYDWTVSRLIAGRGGNLTPYLRLLLQLARPLSLELACNLMRRYDASLEPEDVLLCDVLLSPVNEEIVGGSLGYCFTPYGLPPDALARRALVPNEPLGDVLARVYGWMFASSASALSTFRNNDDDGDGRRTVLPPFRPARLRRNLVTFFHRSPTSSSYDPRFVLRLFSHVLDLYAVASGIREGREENETQEENPHGAAFPTRQWLRQGFLQYAMLCLAEERESVRVLAYGIVRRFAQLAARTERAPDAAQIVQLLYLLREGLDTTYRRLPGPLACALSEMVFALTKGPEHDQYPRAARALVTLPHVDPRDVLLFYESLRSGSPQFARDQRFLLRALERGLASRFDLDACERRHVPAAMMSLVDSALSEASTTGVKSGALRVLIRLAHIDATWLAARFGLLPWLEGAMVRATGEWWDAWSGNRHGGNERDGAVEGGSEDCARLVFALLRDACRGAGAERAAGIARLRREGGFPRAHARDEEFTHLIGFAFERLTRLWSTAGNGKSADRMRGLVGDFLEAASAVAPIVRLGWKEMETLMQIGSGEGREDLVASILVRCEFRLAQSECEGAETVVTFVARRALEKSPGVSSAERSEFQVIAMEWICNRLMEWANREGNRAALLSPARVIHFYHALGESPEGASDKRDDNDLHRRLIKAINRLAALVMLSSTIPADEVSRSLLRSLFVPSSTITNMVDDDRREAVRSLVIRLALTGGNLARDLASSPVVSAEVRRTLLGGT